MKEKKTVCLRLRRSPIVLAFNYIKFFLPVTVLYCFISYFYSKGIVSDSFYNIFNYSYKIIAIILALEFIRRFITELYVFGTRRVIYFNGILSFNLRKTSIKYSHIREVRVTQTIAGRIFNYGTLLFATAATNAHEVVLRDVFNPRKMAKLVEDFLHAYHTSREKYLNSMSENDEDDFEDAIDRELVENPYSILIGD